MKLNDKLGGYNNNIPPQLIEWATRANDPTISALARANYAHNLQNVILFCSTALNKHNKKNVRKFR